MRWPFGINRPILVSLNTRLGKSAVLYPAALLMVIGAGISGLGLVFYLLYRFEASPAVVGIIASARAVSYFAGCFILRPFSRTLLPRYSVILSCALCGLFIVLMVSSSSLSFAALWYCMSGMAFSLFWPPIMGWFYSGLEGRSLSKAITKLNLSWSIGAIISPYLAGYLTGRNRALPFAVTAALYFSVCFMVITASIFLHNVKSDRHVEPRKQKAVVKRDESTFLRFPSWVGIVSTYTLSSILAVVLPIYGVEILNLSEKAIGFMLLTRAAAMTIGFYLLGRTGGWHFRKTPILAVQITLIIIVIALSFARTSGPYFLFVPIIGLLASFSYSASAFHGVSGSPERGKRMSIHEALITMGEITGSTAGGYLFEKFSMSEVLYFAAALAGTALLLQATMLSLRKPRGNRGDVTGGSRNPGSSSASHS